MRGTPLGETLDSEGVWNLSAGLADASDCGARKAGSGGRTRVPFRKPWFLRCFRIPSLCIFDYEFVKFLAFFKPTWSMTPERIAFSESARQALHIVQYPGIKEDVYVPTLRPDPLIKCRLGLDDRKVIVTVRPPANEAHYHDPKSDELFAATIEFLGNEPNVQVVFAAAKP